MIYSSKAICLGFFVLISMACSYLNPSVRDSESGKVGPGERHNLVVYFKSGTTDEQAERFNNNVLFRQRWDGRGEALPEGIESYIGLTTDQGHGHRGFAITFYKKATEQHRSIIKESIKSNDLVYKVFEEIAPNDIKKSDLD